MAKEAYLDIRSTFHYRNMVIIRQAERENSVLKCATRTIATVHQDFVVQCQQSISKVSFIAPLLSVQFFL